MLTSIRRFNNTLNLFGIGLLVAEMTAEFNAEEGLS